MSEMIKEFKNGDLLHIDKDGKAQWGFPEGYPYKEQTGATVEWDGVGEGMESTMIKGKTYYRISELTITHEELLASNITISSSELKITYTGQKWQEIGSGIVAQNGAVSVIMINDAVLAIARDTSMFPKTGIYATAPADKPTAFYLSSISWSTETIYPMAPEFLPSATSTTSGIVKQMPYLPNATGDAPTAENFNQLLRQLKNAGLMK